MYKSDFLGHDELFAPQSKEDSDLFNRFILNGYQVIQSWDALVYHFTSRGSRFNTHAGGAAGKNSEEWIHTTNKNARNFIRKWGHFVKHDEYMKPIVPHKYNIGFVVEKCTLQLMTALEPWCSTLYTDDEMCVIESHYLDLEQPSTKMDLKQRLKLFKHTAPNNDIIVEFDGSKLDQEHFNILMQLPEIIMESGEVGKFELGIFKVDIRSLTTYEHDLIHIYNK